MSQTTSNQILKIVQNAGLTEREAQAYVALLELGKSSADSVARRADLKRATAYVALESLLQQGLVLKVPRARKMMFIAKDPEELVKILELKQQALESVLPSLRTVASGDNQFNAVVYEGVKGIKKALWYKLDDLRDTEYRAFFGVAEHVSKNLEEIILEWNGVNAKRNIRAKAIAPEHESLAQFRSTDNEYLREVKTVPYATYPNKNSIEIYESFARIIMFDTESAVIVESPTLARSLASIHQMLWASI